MLEHKKQTLPKIQQRRLKTQQRNNSYRSNNPKFRKFTYNLKNSISNNEYLKNWLHKDEEARKMFQIFKDAHQPKKISRINSVNPSKQSSSLHKDNMESRIKQLRDKSVSATIDESHLVKKIKPSLNQPAVDEVQIFYSMEIKRGEPSKEKIKNFILILQDHNIFFKKMSPIISETLLKIGIINTYNPNDYIYKQSFPIKAIGIIIWGTVVLKYKKNKIKFNCTSGNTIGEQVIFEKVDYNSKKYSTVQNGHLCANERCKAVQDCGILMIGEKEYGYMSEDLIKWGFKDEMMRFQNILHRNYFKKREFRGLMN